MKNNEIIVKLQEIFRDVLDNESIVLTRETTVDDVDEWDSLSHVQLVIAVEKEFKLKFTSKEIMSWANVGDIIDCILAK